MAVLSDTARAVPQLSHFDLTDFEKNDTVQEFEWAESLIKECFMSLGVSLFSHVYCVRLH
jgi:hypothetical protein